MPEFLKGIGRRGWRARSQASQRRYERWGKITDENGRDISDTIIMVSDMKANIRLQHLERQISQIKRQLMDLGPLHPGSLSQQYNVCGKAGCRCKARPKPHRHGPYYKISYVFRGRFSSRFVPRQQVKAVRVELANYKRLRKLIDAWVEVALRLAKEKRKLPA